MAGYAKSKWWWLLPAPLAIFGVPILLFAMMIGTRFLSVLIGPVNIWNMTTRAPNVSDLAGFYKLSAKNGNAYQPRGAKIPVRSGFRLGVDHTVEVTDLPAFGDFGKQLNCNYSGIGNWNADGDGEARLSINISEAAPGI